MKGQKIYPKSDEVQFCKLSVFRSALINTTTILFSLRFFFSFCHLIPFSEVNYDMIEPYADYMVKTHIKGIFGKF